MPGANYMGGKRNAARARVKDTISRLEKSFFGQRRLCALAKGLLASKPMQRNNNGPPEKSLGRADISLGHAKQRIPPNNDVTAGNFRFVSGPTHIVPSTPHLHERKRKRLEEHSSSSNVSRSKVLDALDISEPVFLRGVLDKILTMPDLAGISKNRTKPAAGTTRQPQASDESSPPQRTKGKRSTSDLYEACRDYESSRYSTSPHLPSSNTPYSNLDSSDIMNWNEGHTGLPNCIVFRGFKDSSATVYGTLFEQADPWDTIGQILGLSTTKSSESSGDEMSEIDQSEESMETRSALVETKEWEENPMSVDSDDISELQYQPLMERGLQGNSSLEEFDGAEELEEARTVISQSSYQDDIEQLSEENEDPKPGVAQECNEHRGEKDYESALAIPELQQVDGLFMGPSLFEDDD